MYVVVFVVREKCQKFASFAIAQLFPGCANVEIVRIGFFTTTREKGSESKQYEYAFHDFMIPQSSSSVSGYVLCPSQNEFLHFLHLMSNFCGGHFVEMFLPDLRGLRAFVRTFTEI